MLNAIVVSIRFILLILGGQKQVALENAALRQQLAVFKRHIPWPKLNNRDRLFWIGLCLIWQDWKSALIFVQPETVSVKRKACSVNNIPASVYAPKCLCPRVVLAPFPICDKHSPLKTTLKLIEDSFMYRTI
jgi:hypothetical protein